MSDTFRHAHLARTVGQGMRLQQGARTADRGLMTASTYKCRQYMPHGIWKRKEERPRIAAVAWCTASVVSGSAKQSFTRNKAIDDVLCLYVLLALYWR